MKHNRDSEYLPRHRPREPDTVAARLCCNVHAIPCWTPRPQPMLHHVLVSRSCCRRRSRPVTRRSVPRPALRKVCNVGSSPGHELTAANLGQIDLLLAPKRWLPVRDVNSMKALALASHHCLVKAELNIRVPKHQTKKQVSTFSDRYVEKSSLCKSFAATFEDEMKHEFWEFRCRRAFCRHGKGLLHGGSALRTSSCFKPARPWISDHTLSLLEAGDRSRESTTASSNGNWDEI